MMMKRLGLVILSFLFGLQPAFAQSNFGIPTATDETYKSRLSEYFFNRAQADILIPVKIVSGVQKPGLYHVPKGTSLTTVLSISGGLVRGTDSSGIQITDAQGKMSQKDFEKILRTGKDYSLAGNEIIFIPEKKYFFDQQTVNTFAVITGLVSVVLTGLIVADQLND